MADSNYRAIALDGLWKNNPGISSVARALSAARCYWLLSLMRWD